VRLLASLLLVWRAVQQPDVFTPAALLAGMALDVLTRESGERLGATFLYLPLAGVLTLSDLS
jgi:hypothetical protein